jgi:hypothetical protein
LNADNKLPTLTTSRRNTFSNEPKQPHSQKTNNLNLNLKKMAALVEGKGNPEVVDEAKPAAAPTEPIILYYMPPTQQVEDYIVVSVSSGENNEDLWRELEAAVKEKINEGYVPHASPILQGKDALQAMVKFNTEPTETSKTTSQIGEIEYSGKDEERKIYVGELKLKYRRTKDAPYASRLYDTEPHGKGKMTYANGDVYEGDYKDGIRHGKGKYTYANGDVYEGDFEDQKFWEDWRDGTPHGKGKKTYTDGRVEEGEWRDDEFIGVYEGDYKDGKWHGKGKLTNANGNAYEGDWKDDKRTGKGKGTWTNGSVFEGDFEDDKWHGKGKFTYGDGRVYEGDFEDHCFHGKGKMTYADGRVEEGEWKADKFIG